MSLLSSQLLRPVRQACVTPVFTQVQSRGYQKGIHPRLYDVRMVNSDGSTYMVKSTLNLGIYYLSDESKHLPSWKKPEVDPNMRDKSGSVDRFMSKYGDLGDLFGTGEVTAAEAAAAAASTPPPAAPASKKGGKGKK